MNERKSINHLFIFLFHAEFGLLSASFSSNCHLILIIMFNDRFDNSRPALFAGITSRENFLNTKAVD
jgi:hypothetical protein